MPASASLTIPVRPGSPAQADEIAAIFRSALGSSEIAVDATAGKVTLRYHFPGDIDTIMRQLYARGLTNSATLAVAVTVRAQSGGSIDSARFVAALSASPAISDVSFDGRTVAATVAAATQTMRALHEALTAAGLELR
jgi:hypothetical protein